MLTKKKSDISVASNKVEKPVKEDEDTLYLFKRRNSTVKITGKPNEIKMPGKG